MFHTRQGRPVDEQNPKPRGRKATGQSGPDGASAVYADIDLSHGVHFSAALLTVAFLMQSKEMGNGSS